MNATPAMTTTVSDIHGKLYPAEVHRIVRPDSVEAIVAAIQVAAAEGRAVSIAGGRHAMGGQQFGDGAILLDMGGMNRLLSLDAARGEVDVEAGIQWPELIAGLREFQLGHADPWGIIQKQTGADRLSIGGALSANVHGRGLAMRPFIDNVVSFTLVDAEGIVRICSRTENGDLFRLAIGGYGLFGVIATVRLRLERRYKVERVVGVIEVDNLMTAFEERIAAGFTYGDFQFAIDPASDDFLRQGVFSCYRPVPASTPIPAGQRVLSRDDWAMLLYLGHVDKRRAVDAYTAHYLGTDGQIYWSDTHQMADYVDHYHVALDAKLGATNPCTEVITEIYVPRDQLASFFADVRDDFRANDVNLIYGTVRLIERDEESVLAWAREPWACTIFNLHVEHTPWGIAHAAAAFQRLIDLAISYGGSYYLTYHRFATRAQVEACHPRFAEFLQLKRHYDSEERFQSDWYRHYREMFADTE
ncbi:MAG: FAD-binding oxidoreductase [Thermomicrobiales bacterium]|nr:FAD-binding oxidoreductase [Thermomicrobiales bacterium]